MFVPSAKSWTRVERRSRLPRKSIDSSALVTRKDEHGLGLDHTMVKLYSCIRRLKNGYDPNVGVKMTLSGFSEIFLQELALVTIH